MYYEHTEEELIQGEKFLDAVVAFGIEYPQWEWNYEKKDKKYTLEFKYLYVLPLGTYDIWNEDTWKFYISPDGQKSLDESIKVFGSNIKHVGYSKERGIYDRHEKD
jgi:hypothetical protein